jgi:hypothetical protein
VMVLSYPSLLRLALEILNCVKGKLSAGFKNRH